MSIHWTIIIGFRPGKYQRRRANIFRSGGRCALREGITPPQTDGDLIDQQLARLRTHRSNISAIATYCKPA
jgi:hypothetical protein